MLMLPAVHILALLDHPKKPLSTILIEQFRPPVGGTVIGTLGATSGTWLLIGRVPRWTDR
jgi:hypothetical protein